MRYGNVRPCDAGSFFIYHSAVIYAKIRVGKERDLYDIEYYILHG